MNIILKWLYLLTTHSKSLQFNNYYWLELEKYAEFAGNFEYTILKSVRKDDI